MYIYNEQKNIYNKIMHKYVAIDQIYTHDLQSMYTNTALFNRLSRYFCLHTKFLYENHICCDYLLLIMKYKVSTIIDAYKILYYL